MVAVEPLRWLAWSDKEENGNIQCSEGENESYGDFGSGIHVQIPDEEDGEDAKGPVCEGAESAMRVC